MLKSATLSIQDLQDILNGSASLGAGGGGPRSIGQQIIDKLVKAETLPVLIQPADLGAGDLGAVSAFAGSPDSATGDFDYTPAITAFTALSKQAAKPLSWVLPGEVGAGNTFIPMAVAASLSPSLPVVDCAGARRAIPALGEDTYAANGVPISPMIVASPDKTIGLTVPDPITADAILRGVISGLNNNAGVAMWTMNGDTVRTSAVEGTTTYALELGRAVRAAPAGQKVARACEVMGARLLGRGTITSHAEETSGGFDLGTLTVACDDGSTLTVYNQNENLIAWSTRSPSPLIMAPDLICFMLDDGTGFSNADPQATPGTIVNVLGQPSIPAMRVPYVITQFMSQLEQIGYAGPYICFE
jgi:uncharacterized protein